ncbi:MAG TPA: hypothetical protein VFP72_21045 [Kineosporiaceae bacterium]|nr:hypothetical protein [Kineosporiaceae bacterium]
MVAGRQGDDPGIGRDRPGFPPGGGVPDLWSLPSGAVSLGDEALLGQDSAFDRLAAVLPVLGEEFPPEGEPDLPGGLTRARSDLRGAHDPSPGTGLGRPAAGSNRPGAATDRPRSGHRTPSTPTRTRSRRAARALSFRALVAILVAVYVAVVAIDLGVSAWRRGAEIKPAEVDIDGPIACPMHRVVQPPQAEADGTCFFVG